MDKPEHVGKFVYRKYEQRRRFDGVRAPHGKVMGHLANKMEQKYIGHMIANWSAATAHTQDTDNEHMTGHVYAMSPGGRKHRPGTFCAVYRRASSLTFHTISGTVSSSGV